MAEAQNVIKMSKGSPRNDDLREVKASLKVMDWAIQLQSIASAAGIPVCDALKDKNTEIPIYSIAGSMGFSNIHSFITSQNGIDIPWEDWENRVSALSYREKFGIYADNAKEIVLEYNDICSILRRPPANAAEYHMAKDSAILSKKMEQEQRHLQERSEMSQRILAVSKERDAETGKYLSEKERSAQLTLQLSKAIQKAEDDIALARIAFNKDKEIELNAIKSEFEKSLAEHTMMIKQESQAHINNANYQMEQLKSHYNSGNYISKKEYNVVEQELANERNNNREYIRKLNEATANYEFAAEQIAALKGSEHDLTSKLSELEQTVASLKMEIEELNNLDMSDISLGMIHMQNKVHDLQSQIENLRITKQQAEDHNSFLKTQILTLRGNLSRAIDSNNKIRTIARDQVLTIKSLTSKINFNYIITSFLALATVASVVVSVLSIS